MDNWLVTNLTAAFIGLLIFLAGFTIGTVLDIISFNLYRRWDHNEKNHAKLIAVAIIQLFIVIFIIHISTPVKIIGNSFAFGIISSQVFLLIYALKTISHQVFDRN